VKTVIDDSDYEVEVLVVEDKLITENVLLGKDILCRGRNKLIVLGNECYVENIRKIQTSQERFSVENELINGLYWKTLLALRRKLMSLANVL